MSELFDLDDLVGKAINREELSRDLYENLAAKTQDEKARKVLKMLARDEEGHALLFSKFLADKNLERLGRRQVVPRSGPPLRVPEIHNISEKSTAKELIAFAIHHEDRAIRYYSRYMDIYRDTELFEFFERMKREEEAHKERLENIFLRDYAGRKG